MPTRLVLYSTVKSNQVLTPKEFVSVFWIKNGKLLVFRSRMFWIDLILKTVHFSWLKQNRFIQVTLYS